MTTAVKRERRPNGDLVALSWLATRAVMWATVGYAIWRHQITLEQAFTRWDVEHFIAIAAKGYADPNDVAFFPGLPLVLRAADLVGIDMWVAGVVLAQVSSIFATWAIFRLYGARAACLWTLAPMAVFTFVPYTEAPFCAAAFWAWERAKSGKWGQAGWLAAVACTFRISGLFLIFALAVLALTQTERPWRQRVTNWLWLALPIGVVAGYVLFLYAQTGSWTAWYSAQNAGWKRSLSWPWEGVKNTWPMTKASYWPGRPEVPVLFRLELVAVAVGYLTLLGCLFKKRWAESAWVAANVVALTCASWFMSVTRSILLLFPLYLLLDELISWQPQSRAGKDIWRLVWIVVLAADLSLLSWWTFTFVTGGWAS